MVKKRFCLNLDFLSNRRLKSLTGKGFFMQITDIVSPSSEVSLIYLAELDRDTVVNAHQNPAVREIATRSGLKVDTYMGLSLNHMARERAVYQISVPARTILVHKDYKEVAEKVTKAVLGESLNKAVLEYQKEHPDWQEQSLQNKSISRAFE